MSTRSPSVHSAAAGAAAARSTSNTGGSLPRRPPAGVTVPSQYPNETRRNSNNSSLTAKPRTSMPPEPGIRTVSSRAQQNPVLPSSTKGAAGRLYNSNASLTPATAKPIGGTANNPNMLNRIPSESNLNVPGPTRLGNVPVSSYGVNNKMNVSPAGNAMPRSNSNNAISGERARVGATNPNAVTRTTAVTTPTGFAGRAPATSTSSNVPFNPSQTTAMMNNGMLPNPYMTGNNTANTLGTRTNSLYGNSLSRNGSFSNISSNKDLYGVQNGYGPMGSSDYVANSAYMMPSNQNSGYGGFGSTEQANSNRGSQMGSVFCSMGPSAFGSAARGSMYGNVSNYGSMYGSGAGVNNMNEGNNGPVSGFGSMYGTGMNNTNAPPFGSMYGGYGSMYGGGGPMIRGSMYGPYGSMYGMNSMYGGGIGIGSMYGGLMPNAMGSMYGLTSYRSVIDVVSRRNSFLAHNDLLRADVKPLRDKEDATKHTNTDKKDVNINIKDENKKDEKSNKQVTSEANVTSKVISDKVKSTSDKVDEKKQLEGKSTNNTNLKDVGVNDTKTRTSEPSSSTSKGMESNNSTSNKSNNMNNNNTNKDTETKEIVDTKKASTVKDDAKISNKEGVATATSTNDSSPSASSDAKKDTTNINSTATSATEVNTNIRGTVMITNTEATKKLVNKKNLNTVIVNDKLKEVDEVIEIDDVNKMVESRTFTELQRTFAQGHKCGLLLGCGKRQRDNLITFAKTFLASCVKLLCGIDDAKFSLFVNAAALRGSEDGKDLLKANASYGKLQQASSPVFGPTLNDLVEREVTTESQMVDLITEAVKNAKEEKEMICFHIVLRLIKNSSTSDAAVYLSAMTLAIAGEDVKHFCEIKEKLSHEPVRLFRYVIGGSSMTLCAVLVSCDDADAGKAVEVVERMREVKNSEPRSGNVKRFADFTRKEIPINKEKMQATTNESRKSSYATMISRMELMLKDAEEMLANPDSTKPKAYV